MSTEHTSDDKPRPGYFRRGEINLLVAHDRTPKDWKGWLDSNKGYFGVSLLPVSDAEISSESNSLLPSQEGAIVYSLLNTRHAHVRFNKVPSELEEADWWEEDSLVRDAVTQLNENAGSCFNNISLLRAAPNWLFTSANHIIGDGGPGGLPVEVSGGPPAPTQYQFDKTEIDRIIGQWGGKPGRQVKVVIFDTVPPHKPSVPFNLTIKPAGELGIRLPPDPNGDPNNYYYTHKDEYEMSDHGLFIAGIIHNIAPDAEIYLVEVLNNYGVGTIETLAEGFRALCDGDIIPLAQLPKENGALVVNCSLCMECPPPNDNGEIVLPIHDSQGNPLTFKSAAHLFEPLRTTVDLFYKQFAALDVQIVAAAGNKGQENVIPLPIASYPAAFDSVLGVGAMESADKRAWYSNLADVRPYDGVMVFGGKGVHIIPTQAAPDGLKEWSETDSADGMLGIYTGMFPPKPNPRTGEVNAAQAHASSNGWGRWSGTSFATGVMSGILAYAAAKGCPISLKKTGNFYQTLHADPATRRTNYGEVIINAPQGQIKKDEETTPTGLLGFLMRLWDWILDLLGLRKKP